jgi:hypothetical protein
LRTRSRAKEFFEAVTALCSVVPWLIGRSRGGAGRGGTSRPKSVRRAPSCGCVPAHELHLGCHGSGESSELVSQALTTVYRAHGLSGAREVVDRFEAKTRTSPGVGVITGVTSLPAARCFERSQGGVADTAPLPIQQRWWRYKCIAQAVRYSFTAFSAHQNDAKQQIAAQYQILAGR